MKKLTFFFLALSGLVAALPAPDSFTCNDPNFPNLTNYFEEANIDTPIPFCSSLLAGGAQETPASAPNFNIQLVTLTNSPESTATASPDDNELGTSTTINTTLPIPPQPTRPLPFPRRHLHALNHRAPSPTDPPSAALSKICSCLLSQASSTPSPPVYITILPRPPPTNEPATPGQVIYITVFPAPFPPIPLNAATTSTSTVVFQLPLIKAVLPSSDPASPTTTTTTATDIPTSTPTTATRTPPLRFITRTTTSSLRSTLTSTETTTTITTVVPQPQRELQLHMKIAHPGPGARPGVARVALAAHGGDDDDDDDEELTTTLTTTVQVTATAETVTVTPVPVPEVTGAVVGAGGRVGAVRVAIVEGSGPGSGEGGQAVGSGMGLYCPGEEARGYCCSDVNNTTGLPGGGGDRGAGKGVECKSPTQLIPTPRPPSGILEVEEETLIPRHLLPGIDFPEQNSQTTNVGPEPRTPICPAERPVPLCCIDLAGDTETPVLGDVRLLRCSPPGPPQFLPSTTMAPPPESSTTIVIT